MSHDLDLMSLQSWFLNALKNNESWDLSKDPWIRSTSKFKSSDRFEVYAYAYFARILESLSEDFEVVKEIIGDENFKKCVRDYLKAYSIRSFNLLDAGEFFSEYIASSPLLEKFPFLSDLAALEYAHLKAFHFFEVSRIEESELLKLFSVDPFFVRVELHPSVFLIKSKWNLKEIYNHPKNRVDKGIYFFIVYEKLKEVFIKKVEEEMYNLLLSFKNNATLGDSLFILGDQPKKIQEAFKMIATEGWMSQVTVDRESQ